VASRRMFATVRRFPWQAGECLRSWPISLAISRLSLQTGSFLWQSPSFLCKLTVFSGRLSAFFVSPQLSLAGSQLSS
jgi:hypothetical protein